VTGRLPRTANQPAAGAQPAPVAGERRRGTGGGALAPAARPGRRPWLIAAAGAIATVVVAVAAGWDVAGWLREVWTSLTSISPLYLVPVLALQTLQTAFGAAAWHGIVTYAYPDAEIPYRSVFACCATGVALNSVTPAHAGTLVTALMLVAIIPTATVAGILAAAAVEKLFFAVVGALVFVYLFLAVGGSFERKFGFLSQNPWAVAIAVVLGAAVAVVVGRLASTWFRRRWEEARAGGKILSDERAYVRRVLVPQMLSWGCKIGVVAVMLAAYGIPVGFHTVFSVIAGNSLAGVASLTPGGLGINQALHVASLHEVTSAANASAYSIGQQLVTTVWNIVLAVVLVGFAFGRSGGKQLVADSSTQARQLQAEPRS
jgi:uncharacterized membrane protein YbhN (UPF0104 family)